MKKYDLRQIMKKAWKIFRKARVTFAEALHRAWLSEKAVYSHSPRGECGLKFRGISNRAAADGIKKCPCQCANTDRGGIAEATRNQVHSSTKAAERKVS